MRPSGGWATAETMASVQPSRITSGGTGAGAGGVGPEDEEEPQPEASSRNASTANLCTTAPPFQLPDSLLFGFLSPSPLCLVVYPGVNVVDGQPPSSLRYILEDSSFDHLLQLNEDEVGPRILLVPRERMTPIGIRPPTVCQTPPFFPSLLLCSTGGCSGQVLLLGLVDHQGEVDQLSDPCQFQVVPQVGQHAGAKRIGSLLSQPPCSDEQLLRLLGLS